MCDSEKIMGMLQKLKNGEIECLEIVYRDIEVLNYHMDIKTEHGSITIEVRKFELNWFSEGVVFIDDYNNKERLEIDFDIIKSIESVE